MPSTQKNFDNETFKKEKKASKITFADDMWQIGTLIAQFLSNTVPLFNSLNKNITSESFLKNLKESIER